MRVADDVVALTRHDSDGLLLFNALHQTLLLLPDGRDKVLELLNDSNSMTSPDPWADEVLSLLECQNMVTRGEGGNTLGLEPTLPVEANDVSVYIAADDLRCNPAYLALIEHAATIAKDTLHLHFGGEDPMVDVDTLKKAVADVSAICRRASLRWFTIVSSPLSDLPDEAIEWLSEQWVMLSVPIEPPDLSGDTSLTAADYEAHLDLTGKADRIHTLVGLGIPVVLRCRVTSLNVDSLPDTAAYLSSLNRGTGLELPPLMPFHPSDGQVAQELLPDPVAYGRALQRVYAARIVEDGRFTTVNELRRRLTEGGCLWNCGMPVGCVLAVGGDGKVYPCPALIGVASCSIGNASDTTLLPGSQLIARFQDQFRVDRLEGCKTCAWRHICGGPCPAMLLLAEIGSLPRSQRVYCREVLCQSRRALLEAIVWDLALEKAEEARQMQPPLDRRKVFQYDESGRMSVVDA